MKHMANLIILMLLIFASSLHAEEPKERAEIADEYKWDLTDMYASTAMWEADILKYQRSLTRDRILQGTSWPQRQNPAGGDP